MTSDQVKSGIKKMKKYNINKLSDFAVKSGVSLMVVNFWWNAIKN